MSDENSAETTSASGLLRDRRAVLRGAAVAGLAGVSVPLLAACGSDETAGSTAPTTSAPPATTPTGSTPAGTPSATTSAPAAGGPVLGATADIPVGGGKIFKDARIVVTQPAAGQFKGFTAVCTHSGCLVSKIEGDTIDCVCHGSSFKVSDGSVVSGPARDPLAAVAVTVKEGNVLGPAS